MRRNERKWRKNAKEEERGNRGYEGQGKEKRETMMTEWERERKGVRQHEKGGKRREVT